MTFNFTSLYCVATFYKDERCSKLKIYPILESIYVKFITHQDLYEWIVIPFRIANALCTLQILMNGEFK
ncbi:hypothetical protein MTR_5g079750 [Medicago truncatula]|uniref:Uncharacterized protein n=1 Tax=Medicago truncatula TaxID=3880 RepID=G7KBQ0_MEDTR|nr:hypothetical protein MTR_5g079750 [Medicago truncatula]